MMKTLLEMVHENVDLERSKNIQGRGLKDYKFNSQPPETKPGRKDLKLNASLRPGGRVACKLNILIFKPDISSVCKCFDLLYYLNSLKVLFQLSLPLCTSNQFGQGTRGSW